MKVLWIAPIKHPKASGHPAPWVEQLAIRLGAHVDLTILALSPEAKKKIEVFNLDNAKKIFLKSLRPKLDVLSFKLIKIWLLKRWLKQKADNYDIIHIHGNEHQFEVACRDIDIPKLISIQGIISEYLKHYKPSGFQLAGWLLSRWYELRNYNTINYYSCRTHWDQSIVKQYNPKAKIFEIWEMIRSEFFIEDTLPKGDNVLFIGGTQKIKGFDIALQSFALVKDKLKGKLLIGGNVSTKKLVKIIQDQNLNIHLERDIEILGFLDANGIIKAAKRSFCFLHPTLIDNSPNSVCEAQVLGLPVIAADVGGVSSLIEHGKTGLLTDHNPAFIADQMLKLYEDHGLWSKISAQSRTIARVRHDPDQIVEETIKMYQQIITDNA
jgi:glycosyltransferase involved in cell wall biosynthesis